MLASQSSDAEERRQAFEALVEAYWKPVYKFVRIKWRCDADDAADYTQGFFARAIEKDFFRSYDPSKGSFRTFLRVCLEGFVANEKKAASRSKRGGDTTVLSLDFSTPEGELRGHPPSPGASPEESFHREWVRSLFQLALDDLRELCEARGKRSEFEIFSRYDLDEAAKLLRACRRVRDPRDHRYESPGVVAARVPQAAARPPSQCRRPRIGAFVKYLSDDAIARLQQIVDTPDVSGTRYRIIEKIATRRHGRGV